MTSHPSNCMSDLKNFLTVNVNCSNSISRIFQNELGLEIFTKKIDTAEIYIAPFETIQDRCLNSKDEPSEKKAKENLIRRKRNQDDIELRNTSSRAVNKPEQDSDFEYTIMREKEFLTTSKQSGYLLSEKINSSFDGSKVDVRWTKKEEIGFIGVCLVYKVSGDKLKLSNFINLVETRSKKQFYRHYYANKTSIKKLCDLFIAFNGLSIGIEDNPKAISEMLESFKKKIFDKEFIEFFNSKEMDEKSKKYFQNIYGYITLEPRFYLKPNQPEKDLYNSPKPKFKNCIRSSAKENLKYSSRNKSSSANKLMSGFKLEDDLILKNLNLKIEDKLYTKLLSFSKNGKLIIDDLFLFEYAMSEF